MDNSVQVEAKLYFTVAARLGRATTITPSWETPTANIDLTIGCDVWGMSFVSVAPRGRCEVMVEGDPANEAAPSDDVYPGREGRQEQS